jgi:ferredoxin
MVFRGSPAAAVAKDGNASPDSEMAEAGEFTITFSRSGRSAFIRTRKTILEAAEAAGVSIDYQCRSGICGTCRCQLLHGRVKMDVRDALSDSDEAAGYILACQARPFENVAVEA